MDYILTFFISIFKWSSVEAQQTNSAPLMQLTVVSTCFHFILIVFGKVRDEDNQISIW